MKKHPVIDVIIPAFNEEGSIGKVVADLPAEVREIIVVDNNSTDRTGQAAREAGATVLSEPRQGYGNACLRGIAHIAKKAERPDIVVFLDADYSDHPDELPCLIAPIVSQGADMVIGSRALGARESGSMTIPQRFGNWLATVLLRVLYKVRYTDLGPFRAIRWEKLVALNMQDRNYGWTVEMQVKAARAHFSAMEVPVRYRKRIGYSKVSGTVKGTVMAGFKILLTIFKYA